MTDTKTPSKEAMEAAREMCLCPACVALGPHADYCPANDRQVTRTALTNTQATAARYRACTNADSTEAADNCNQFPKWIGPGVTAFSEDDLDLDG